MLLSKENLVESVDRYMLVVKKNQSTILTTLFYHKGNKRKYDTFCYPMFLFCMNIINQCRTNHIYNCMKYYGFKDLILKLF